LKGLSRVKENFHARFLGEGKTAMSFPYPIVSALNEKLSEFQLGDVEVAINCLLKHMANALAQGQRIEIRGFGGFDLHHRAPRSARNPMTGEAVQLPAKVVLHFKPGKDMKDRVNAAREQYVIEE
jgi:integration host factor subunit beta